MRVALALVLAACTEPVGADSDPDATLVATFSPIGQHVYDALHDGHAAGRGVTWALSSGNSLDAGWVVQTPIARWGQPAAQLPVTSTCAGDAGCDPDFDLRACTTQADCTFGGTCTVVASTVARPGQVARSLCTGHSDAIYDRIYGLVTQATTTVEIASLGPPDGRFEAALRNAITFLATSGRAIRVRYLWGAIPGAELAGEFRAPGDVLASLVRDVPAGAPIRVGVGNTRATVDSWAHAKIIAIDGHTALVGGHNMWTRHYLQHAPTFDLSMQVSGPAALQASTFVDQLWREACVPRGGLGGDTEIVGMPDANVPCTFEAQPTPPVTLASDDVHVLSVGRLGALGDEASDDAIAALIDASTSHLQISQQDLGPVGPGLAWPEYYLRALGGALTRGVDIDFVMTNLDARPDGLTAGSAAYSNGWTPADVAHQLAAYADASAICNHFHGTTLHPSSDNTWPDGASFANHAKLVIADDRAFYLGSQNLYPANLAEFGYIVDDASATSQLVDAYFAHAWTMSQRGVTASCAP